MWRHVKLDGEDTVLLTGLVENPLRIEADPQAIPGRTPQPCRLGLKFGEETVDIVFQVVEEVLGLSKMIRIFFVAKP